jgi:hypothetical protein
MIPEYLFDDLRALGVEIHGDDDGLRTIMLTYGDAGWNRYAEWLKSLSDDADPTEFPKYRPSPAIQGSQSNAYKS